MAQDFRVTGPTRPSWGVVVTCSEPLALTLGFAAHYLALGASEIQVFLDRPQATCASLLARLPGVTVTLCDGEHWARASRFGRRPDTVTQRQLENAALAYARSGVDWLMHVDCDEFLLPTLPFHEILAGAPDNVEYLHFRNLERSLLRDQPQRDIFDGVFRHAVPPLWMKDLPDRLRTEPYTRGGFTGHLEGKTIQRTGLRILPGIHSPRPLPEFPRRYLNSWTLPTAHILHFEGMTRKHWTSKLSRLYAAPRDRRRMRRTQPVRHAHLQFLEENATDPQAVHHLYDRLKVLDRDDAARLEALGLLERPDLDIGRSLNEAGLAGEVETSVAAFDAELDQPPFAA
ncbi:hypothetical protein E0K89_021380 [Aquicoccus sp. SCR17]|nr:hypothetical protein [Carideicomes alvinocaridis]